MIVRDPRPLSARALGVGGENTTIPNVFMPSTTSSSPFFPTGTQLSPPTSTSTSSDDVTKVVLEWVFAVAALAIVLSLTIWRYARLRRTNRPLNAFIPRPRPMDRTSSSNSVPHPRNLPRTTGLPLESVPGPAPLVLPNSMFYPLPARMGGRGRHPIRGANIDARGRRIDTGDPDELPAYDSLDRPPKYLESGIAGISHMEDIPLHELHRAATRSTLEGPSSQTTHDQVTSESTLYENDAEERSSRPSTPPALPEDSSSQAHADPPSAYTEPVHPASASNDGHDHDRME